MEERIYKGDLVINETGIFPYTKVTGSLCIYSSASLAALTSVGVSLSIQPSAKLEAPALTSVGGTLYIQPSAKLEAPKVIYNDKNALALCRKSLNDSFAKNGFVLADGILAKLISRRGPVSRVIICGKNEISYLVTDGENYAHGKTLKEARESLIYKITSRDTSEFKVWRLDEIVTKRDAIRAYRAITGACEAGVRTWMEQRKTPESISIKDIIKLTEGSYGAREFKEFFENK